MHDPVIRGVPVDGTGFRHHARTARTRAVSVRAKRSRAGALAAMLATLAVFGASSAIAKKQKPALCPDGRLVVGGAGLVASAPGTPVVVSFHGGRLMVDGACSPTSAKAKPTKRGSTLKVAWKTCNGHKKVVLSAKTTPACDGGGGTLAAKKVKKTSLTLARSTCGDGVIDASGGEQCDGSACAGSDACSNACACEPAVTAQVTGVITDGNGPLAGVAVADASGAPMGTTDGAGHVTLTLMNGVPHVLRLSKAGYVASTHVVDLPLGTPSDYFERGLSPRDAAQDVDATTGGTIAGRDGARIVIPAGALVDENGAAVTGTVHVSQTPLDVSGALLAGFPGDFVGIATGGAPNPIATLGTVEYALEQSGHPLQLADGFVATIDIPIYTSQNLDGTNLQAGDVLPVWSLDESTGKWMQNGTGTVVAAAGSPTGLALRASVPHLSWWNCDVIIVPPPPYQPKPRCYVDSGAGTLIETECSIGPQPYGVILVPETTAAPRHRAPAGAVPAAPAGFTRPPNYAVRALVPVGGLTVQLPADVPVVVHACTLDGTRCQTKTLQGGSSVAEDVQFVLMPIGGGGGTITAPWNQDYAIDPAGEVDHFTFDGQAGETYAISVTRAATSFMEGAVSVSATGGALLDDDRFDQAPGALTVTLPSTGNYTIDVDGTVKAPGGYTLRFAKLAAPAETPIALPFHNDIYILIAPTQLNRFVVSATQGQSYGVILRPSASDHAGSGTVRARLRDGTELARTRLGPGRGADLVFTAPASGDVLVEVGGQEAHAEGFDLSVFPLTLGADEAVAIPFERTDQLTESVHRYRVTADARRILRTTFGGAYQPYALIMRDGRFLDTATYAGSGFAPLTTTLPDAGEYTLEVHCGYLCAGSLPSIATQMTFATELTPGAASTGTIAAGGDIASFVFDGQADQPYFVGVYSDTNADELGRTVTDFTGQTQSVTGFNQTIQPGTTTPGGRFTVDVRRASNGTGAFTVNAMPIDQPTAVDFSGSVATATGMIDVPGRQRYYAVTLAAGDMVKLAVDSPIPNGEPGLGVSAQLLLPTSATRFWSPNISPGTARTNFGGSAGNSGHAETNVLNVGVSGTWIVAIVHEGQWLANATGAFTWTLTKQ